MESDKIFYSLNKTEEGCISEFFSKGFAATHNGEEIFAINIKKALKNGASLINAGENSEYFGEKFKDDLVWYYKILACKQLLFFQALATNKGIYIKPNTVKSLQQGDSCELCVNHVWRL